ncbi:MAG TPA: hypothetical protein VNG51_28495 [Ktedonobacteraceae bacterium]|nr:hypothetical protein [Ktedonobacteraceae bacterium]
MAQLDMRANAHRVMYFVIVQFIALAGWVIVQSFFFLSPIVQVGHNISFAAVMVIEIIWWLATLVIMFLLFRREYTSFVTAVLALEDANTRLRHRTNVILSEVERNNAGDQGEGSEPA